MLQSQQKLFLWQTQVSPVCQNAPISTEITSITNPSIPSVQKCSNLNGNYFHGKPKHLQCAAMSYFQWKLFLNKIQASTLCRNAPIPMKPISVANPSISGVQKCSNLNRNYFHGKFKHLQSAEMPQSQQKLFL